MRVIATARGYDNLKTREIDEEFDMPDEATGSWFSPLDEDPKPKAKGAKSDKPPKTMSEHADQSDETPAP